ncbi:hypothetical protein QQY66_40110 [Streptomyces sp. DG2A-72]|nr:hypothetical protein [Streptomyces sp. DG2A-72]MDO0937633.1 hypothetical protein [Streptomyces sp. DG2A-72]
MKPPQRTTQRPMDLPLERLILRGGDQRRRHFPEFEIALPASARRS